MVGQPGKETVADMVRLADIPALGINLDRRPDRLQNVRKLAKSFGFYSFEKVTAVDGRQLEKSAGSFRKVSGSLYRLSWTDEGIRKTGFIKLSPSLQKLAHRDLVSRWGLYGCAQSHINGLTRAIALFDQRSPAVCILEDDVGVDADAEKGQVDEMLQALEGRRRGWKICSWAEKRVRIGLLNHATRPSQGFQGCAGLSACISPMPTSSGT